MAQFFHSRTVANSILFVGKIWNSMKKDSIINLNLLVKYIKACPDVIIKTSKYWLLYYLLWKMFLSVDINSEVIETVAQNCFLKKDLPKILKNLNFFWSLFLKVTNRWLLLKTLSRITHQNFENFQGKHLSLVFVIV